MNKYKKHSRKAQKKRRKEKMCINKKPFNNEADAFQKGQEIYKCPYCNKFHRSGQLAKLVFKIKKTKP